MLNKKKNILKSLLGMIVQPAIVFGWIFASSIGQGATGLNNSDGLTVTIRVKDVYPPAPVTDLSATPGAAGQMLLEWTAPDSNNNVFVNKIGVTSYEIKIATFSIDAVGSTTTWWNSAQTVTPPSPPVNPGVGDLLLLNGLTVNTTYYAALRSIDDQGFVSLLDTNATTPTQQAFAFIAGSNMPATPSNLAGIALSTSSIQWSWDVATNAGFYMLNEYPSGALIQQTTNLIYVDSLSGPNVQVSRTIRSGNAYGLSTPSSAITVYTLAAPPNNLQISNVGFTTITLTWNGNGNPANTQTRVERSLDGVSFLPVTSVTTTTFQDSGLSELTTYYYRVRSINEDGISTSYSSIVSTRTPLQIDFIPPMLPAGLKGILDPTGQAFTLLWDEVTHNVDGTPITDLAGYNIYRRSTLVGGPGTKLNSSPITVATYADQVNNQTYYYVVRAVDTSGNESFDSLIADSSSEVNVIFLGADNLSSVVMPGSVNNLLRSDFNKYGISLTIQLEEKPVPSNTELIRSIRLKLLRVDNMTEIDDLAFADAQSVVSVGYNVVNGQIARGEPQGFNSSAQATGISPDRLSLYWHNGVSWIKIGGTVDLLNQAVRTKSSYLGNYQLRVAAQATSLSLDQGNVYPRVFSPNQDGLNDRVYFVLENPNDASVTGEIYDMKGRHVATLDPPELGIGIGTTLTWDGTDLNGSVVPGGVYIYRIKGEGQTFSGTVGVAR